MYKIEKNIPVLKPTLGRPGSDKYPFQSMRSGDSFAVPVDPDSYETWVKVHARVCSAVQGYCRSVLSSNSYAKYFAVRKDRKNDCVRVWKL